MTDESGKAITDAAVAVDDRRTKLIGTTQLLKRRLDPRLIVSDLAKLAVARSIGRIGKIAATPKQRKRALIGGGIAAVTAIGLRVLYRNDGLPRDNAENPSHDTAGDVKRLR